MGRSKESVMKYLVSYDLVGKDPDYESLWQELRAKEGSLGLSLLLMGSPSCFQFLGQPPPQD